jgi:hypothetical protein
MLHRSPVPKGGTTGERYPTDEEWKEVLKLRLGELGWSNAELARKLNVTPAAITHLFKKAVTSTLKPEIEKLVGWPDVNAHSSPSRMAIGTRRPSSTSRGINSEQLAELISYFQALSQENRVRLLERAHALWDSEVGSRKDSHG